MSLQFVHSHDALQPHSAAIWGVAVTATNDILSISLDGTLALHASSSTSLLSPLGTSPSPGTRLRTWPTHPLAWVSLSVAPNDPAGSANVSKRALVNSIAGTTVLFDYTTGEELGRKLIGEKESGPGTKSGWAEPAWTVSLCADGKTYASTGGSGAVTIHSAEPSSRSGGGGGGGGGEDAFGTRLAHIPTGRSKFGLYIDYSPIDSTKIAMSNETGQVFVADTVKEAVTNSWASHAMPVRSLGWSGDGNLLISASDDRQIVLYDARTSSSSTPSSAVAHLSGHTHSVLSVALSPGDGRLALSGGRDGTVRIWDVGMRKAVGIVTEGGAVWSVAWRPIDNGDSGGGGAGRDVEMGGGGVGVVGGAYGGIGGSGAMGFVTGGEEGAVRWYRGAGVL